ncbi:MAG TPA: hypothetical protein VKR41_01170, partial [Puia sp.]|nr:hypothetical protein [Puia sp.]
YLQEILFHPKLLCMNKMLAFLLLLTLSSGCFAQIVGKVDKKTKEFSIPGGQKVDYMVFGYRFANANTEKYICFASNENVERANQNLPLGSYFDTDRLPPGAKITWLGMAGTFGKMKFTTGGGKTTLFYLPKSCYLIK